MRGAFVESLGRVLGSAWVGALLGLVGIVAGFAVADTSVGTALILAVALVAVVVLGAILGGFLLRDRYAAPYEARSIEHVWDIDTPDGSHVTHRKTMQLRYLQDNTISVWDSEWGEGDIRATVGPGPATLADSFKLDGRTYHLASLRASKSRGDEQTLTYEREWIGGFTEASEWISVETESTTRRIAVDIVFPAGRPPRRIVLEERRRGREQELDASLLSEVGGRTLVRWARDRPGSNGFVFRWDW